MSTLKEPQATRHDGEGGSPSHSPPPTGSRNSARSIRMKLFRIGWIYARGALVAALIVILAQTIAGIAADALGWFGRVFEDGQVAGWQVAVALAIVLAVPLIIGQLTELVVPLFQQDRGVQALMRWERRLFRELTPGKGGYKVALLNWPNADVRTLVVVGSTFSDPDTGRELAPVYFPNTPNFSSGRLYAAPMDELSFTEWSLSDLANLYLSFGSAVPPSPAGEDDERS